MTDEHVRQALNLAAAGAFFGPVPGFLSAAMTDVVMRGLVDGDGALTAAGRELLGALEREAAR